MIFFIESPQWLIEQDRLEEASASLQFIRNQTNVATELQEMIHDSKKHKNTTSSWSDVYSVPSILSALTLGCMLQVQKAKF